MSSAPVAAYAIAILSRGYEATLASFQDDASYYFVIAEHIVRTQRSTFDGVTSTNGYHPLWFALNVLLVELSRLDRHIYVTALVVLCAALAVVHGALLRQLLSSLVRVTWVADVIVSLVTLRCLPLAFCGMECAVAMPLLVGCALLTLKLVSGAKPSVVPLVSFGLLVSLTGLARLDAVLFGLGCIALVSFAQRRRGLRSCVSSCAACCAGLLPFIAYLCWNWQTQGALLTTSARSKMLALGISWNGHLFDQLSFGEHVTFLYVPLAAAVLLCSPWAPWRGATRRVAFLIFVFPACYYASIALRSSWLIWIWYLYPLPLCMAVGLAALSEAGLAVGGDYRFRSLPKGWALAIAVPIASVVAFRVANKPRPNQGVLDAALKLGEFSRQHPGQYAMGDRSGLTALLVDRSFLQLEGLVADGTLLDLIREQGSLSQALATYHVDYLVEALVTSSVRVSRCQDFSEPKERQAGARSPKLHGTFCDPVFRYDDPVDHHTTLVYRANGDSVLGALALHKL